MDLVSLALDCSGPGSSSCIFSVSGPLALDWCRTGSSGSIFSVSGPFAVVFSGSGGDLVALALDWFGSGSSMSGLFWIWLL